MNLFKLFSKEDKYKKEHAKLIQLRDLYKSENLKTDYQKARSLLVYYEAVYDCRLCEEIKRTSDSHGNYKYEFRFLSPLILQTVDNDIMDKAEKNLSGSIKEKDLVMPGILSLDNPVHYVFSYRISERFESIVRTYGLDNYSLDSNGLTNVEEHITDNLMDYKGVIFNALSYLRDYQNSYRKDPDLAVDGDYFEELLEKLERFK